jgi:hypothetical protein
LKQYAQKPDRGREVTWEISESGIRTTTASSTSDNTWALFVRAVKAREGFLLYPQGRSFYWLPLDAFRDPADAERFAQLAKSKVKDYVEIP